jgi:hypothetical protein
MASGLILFTGIYFLSSAIAAEPAAKPGEAVKASTAKPAEAAKAPAKPAEADKAPEKPADSAMPPAKEASLKLVPGPKGAATIELQNDIPVRALQFSVAGAKITEVRTAGRTKGYLVKFNDKNGMVIILSTAGEEIAPGKGSVAEIACDKPAAAILKDVKIVGKSM